MKKLITTLTIIMTAMTINAKTLIVYYSYTNNVERIINELHSQIDADVIEIEPAEKGLDYAANNYAIGSAQIAAIRSNPDKASSYPAIDAVNADLSQYSTIIIGAPLWWSNMAAPLQTFLFHHGKEMAGKNIGLIVSSASSGINGVEGDAKRLIPSGKFLSPSLWIRSSQTSNAATMISNWLTAIGYKNLSGIDNIESDASDEKVIAMYNLSGQEITDQDRAGSGIYIVKSMVDNRIITKKVAMTIR